MKTKARIIKKYGNRRLYDSSSSRYVNLDEIAAMIRAGEDIEVVDAKSGEDLTRVTLTQIILEDAKAQPTGLPLELLRHLIVATDQVGREFVMWYLKSAFSAFQKVQGALQSGFGDVRAAALSPLEMVKGFMQRGTPEPSETEERAQVRRRLEELEARLKKSSKSRKRAKPKPRG